MRGVTVVIAVVALILVVGVPPAAGEAPEIEARAALWTKAFNAGDVEGVASLYTENAHVMPPNGEMARGREAVRASFSSMIDADLTGELESVEANASGELAYRVGKYVVKSGDGTVVDRGKFIEIWEKVDGQWMIDADIWNSSLPVPGAEEDSSESPE